MVKALFHNGRLVACCFLLVGLLLAAPAVSLADDTVCARVKIEIRQELTLERQAFDAHMRINNGLTNISLEDVKVDVSFADEDGAPVLATSDPANTDALFFEQVVRIVPRIVLRWYSSLTTRQDLSWYSPIPLPYPEDRSRWLIT